MLVLQVRNAHDRRNPCRMRMRYQVDHSLQIEGGVLGADPGEIHACCRESMHYAASACVPYDRAKRDVACLESRFKPVGSHTCFDNPHRWSELRLNYDPSPQQSRSANSHSLWSARALKSLTRWTTCGIHLCLEAAPVRAQRRRVGKTFSEGTPWKALLQDRASRKITTPCSRGSYSIPSVRPIIRPR